MHTPREHVVFTDLDGAEAVLVDLNSRQYFLLNETASLVWRGVTRGHSAASIAAEMTEVYDVALEKAQSSVAAALSTFVAHDLLSPPR